MLPNGALAVASDAPELRPSGCPGRQAAATQTAMVEALGDRFALSLLESGRQAAATQTTMVDALGDRFALSI